MALKAHLDGPASHSITQETEYQDTSTTATYKKVSRGVISRITAPGM